MTRKLREGLKQSKPSTTLEEKIGIELHLTAQVVLRWLVEALKPSGLTEPQFNVLRILRGACPEALSCSAVAERMVTYDPDLTRLMDRLEAQSLIEKSRHLNDRRVVNVHITKAGLAKVESASLAVRRRLKEEMAGLGPRKLESLADLLERVRTSGA
jgi:DNA-binding MarR family transcriptional regulator